MRAPAQDDTARADPLPGLHPPIPAWAPLAWFIALASVLTFVVTALVQPPGPLDDAEQAYQRDGLLLDGPVVPEEVLGVEFGERVVVLLFVRERPGGGSLQEWVEAVPGQAVAIVVPEPAGGSLGGTNELPTVVLDPLGKLADVVGMPTPVDGGPPVGYAVVDADRVVRYATIDPSYLTNRFELETIVKAVSKDEQ